MMGEKGKGPENGKPFSLFLTGAFPTPLFRKKS
jgi:hypothetical protein